MGFPHQGNSMMRMILYNRRVKKLVSFICGVCIFLLLRLLITPLFIKKLPYHASIPHKISSWSRCNWKRILEHHKFHHKTKCNKETLGNLFDVENINSYSNLKGRNGMGSGGKIEWVIYLSRCSLGNSNFF